MLLILSALFIIRYIDSMNRKNLSYKLKVNHMADLSDVEMKRMRGYRTSKDSPRGEMYYSKNRMEDIPDFYNWRIRGESMDCLEVTLLYLYTNT